MREGLNESGVPRDSGKGSGAMRLDGVLPRLSQYLIVFLLIMYLRLPRTELPSCTPASEIRQSFERVVAGFVEAASLC